MAQIPKRLCQERLQAVERLLNRYLNDKKIPCYACLVSHFGEEILFFKGGKMDVERDRPVQRDTLFRIYSMTKPLTSIAIMQLFEQGRFQLDDPVSRFIPSWKNLKVFVSGDTNNYQTTSPDRPMTIKDLLTHTSGLTYGFQHSHPVDEIYRNLGVDDITIEWSLEERIKCLADIPLQFSPGSRWNYSISTDILGYLVELIAQEELDSYFRRCITGPLKMENTSFKVSPENQNRFSACYEYDAETGGFALQDDPQSSPYMENPHFFSGGGGMVSSIDDYNRFTLALLGKGQHNGTRIIGARTLEFMTINHLPNNRDLAAMGQPVFAETPFEGIGFGLGFSVVLDPARANIATTLGEFAWGGAASTYFWVDPIEQINVVFMTQLLPSNAYPLRRELKTAVYQSLI
ncbi:MAG: serine hydrolase domain-containing protein [bacterium]